MVDNTELQTDIIPDAPKRKTKWPIIFMVAGIPILWIASWLIIWTYFGNLEEASRFGSMFGAISALFSGLALAGIVIAIYQQREELRLQRKELVLQRKELRLQRQELVLTRNELARSADAQEKSELVLTKQAEALNQTARLSVLQFLPLFELKAHLGEDGRSSIIITNVGDTPSFDINLRVLAVYSDEVVPVHEFVRTKVVKADLRLKAFEESVFGEYSISDSFDELSMPVGTNLSGRLIVPPPVSRLLILFQYRDAYGNNYSQLYSHLADTSAETPHYKLFKIDPIAPKVCARLVNHFEEEAEFTGNEDDSEFIETPLVTEDNSFVPEHLDDFTLLWARALPISFVSINYLSDNPRLILRKPRKQR